jgi:ferrochelatase
MDSRVIDVPWPVRKLIVEGFILPRRPKKSAHAYSLVWTPQGAPLKVFTEAFRKELQPLVDMPLAVAMRYGNPTPREALLELESNGSQLEELWIAPLYPHYAMSSYETALVYAQEEIRTIRPSLNPRILQPFYDEPTYIRTLADSIRPYLEKEFDKVLFSYHGLPVRHLKKTDPTKSHCYQADHCCDINSPAWKLCYKHQVLRTARLTAEALGLSENQYSCSFQSRLGQDEWIKPFTVERLEKFPKEGVTKLLVVCPAFVSDCLETLEEMALRGKETFLGAGGKSFQLIPCLNASMPWVKTFARYCNEAEGNFKTQWKAEVAS